MQILGRICRDQFQVEYQQIHGNIDMTEPVPGQSVYVNISSHL